MHRICLSRALRPAAIIVFVLTTGCTDKNKMAPTTKKSDPLAAGAAGEARGDPVNAVPVAALKRYAGQLIQGDPMIGAAPAGRVIRDQAGYDALVAALPRRRIQMKQPAPLNEDPLLQKPTIDFTRQMLVVATRRSMFHGPKIKRVLLIRGKELIVEILHESPEGIMAMASRSDVGTYEAVVVSRADEKPAFRVEKKTIKPAGR